MCTICNTNCNSICPPTPCACKVFLSSDCIDNVTEDLECSNILKGKTLTETLVLLDAYICERFTSVEDFIRIINVGEGSEIYKGDTILGKKQLRTLLDSNLINLVQGTDDITISVDETALNTFIEANQKIYSAANIGTGSGIYKSVTIVGDSNQLNLRKIKSSDSSVSIIEGTDDIDITVSASVVPDGSETKITAGTNVTVSGTGTTATPYIINATDTNTTYSAGSGMILSGTTFNNVAPDQTVVLTQGGATTITGTYPYFTISSTDTNTIADGSETKINSGTTTAITGTGTIASPYVVETVNLQKVITASYTLTTADNNYTILVNNSAVDVTITIPTGLMSKINVGFIQQGSGSVTFVAGSGVTINTPISGGFRIKGINYNAYIEQINSSNVYHLLGNIIV
jgi:hypothetical protein